MGRAPCCDKEKVKKGPWSPEEDEKLKAYIQLHGTAGNWIALPHKIGLKRCGKSCRLRWLNYLRPNIKHGGFSEEEDEIICSLFITIGSRWSIIAAQLPGRTDNDIKNYWNTRLKKKLLGTRKQYVSNNKLSSHGDSTDTTQALTNSAIERLQLQMQLQALQSPFSFNNASTLWPPMWIEEVKVAQTAQPPNENCVDGACCSVATPLLEGCAVNGASIVTGKSPVGSSPTEVGDGGGREVECVKEMDGSSKESLYWWSNDIDAKSAVATKLWDTASVDLQFEGIFKDFEQLGYSL